MLSSVNDTTFQFFNGVNSFWISGYPIGDNCRPNLSDGMQSSWRLAISNVHDSSLELSGSLEVQDLSDNDIKEDAVENFQEYMDAICECMASDSASCSVSSERTLHMLLLVGYKNSGTSTIFKQAQIVYEIPFAEEERQSIKCMIQSNLYGYLGILLEVRERFEEECLIKKSTRDQCSPLGQIKHKTMYSIGPRLKAFSDWLLKVMVSGNLETIFPAATHEYAPFVEELWKDQAIQATYEQMSELELLPRVATYFLERAVEIAMTDYQPSDMDILYAEGIAASKGISSMEFSFSELTEEIRELDDYLHDPLLRYQLIRVHPGILGGNCKWLELFEDVDIVLFCVSLTDYDEFEAINGVCTNKMMASKQLFETIVMNQIFKDKKFLLILNKFDLLEEKIVQVPLTQCEWFHDFNPVIVRSNYSRNRNTLLAHHAFQYIAVKFKRLFRSLTNDKTLYVSPVTGLEPVKVEDALKYATEILKWDRDEFMCPNQDQELSSASTEASSSS